jgi:hypothetical protein
MHSFLPAWFRTLVRLKPRANCDVFLNRLARRTSKLGQFIASAPGIFPDSYVTEMQSLLDRTTPVDFADIERVLAADLGKDYRKHFRSY